MGATSANNKLIYAFAIKHTVLPQITQSQPLTLSHKRLILQKERTQLMVGK